ncbi:diguanylate cyclase [Marinomonas ostreistagni]|uniref:diguanylate cyclase n=1 Tax=Marinomonas ostreistagni TaxID=359209 RepID=UPI00194F7ACF|nr:diguanylate cyclase [Marinomonas ostreistagni]MBM6550579.1 GGDEF domain-containing protein [Marinomonas ostreistagni]
MERSATAFITALCALLLCCSQAWAQPVIAWDTNQTALTDFSTSYFIDSSETMSLAEVIEQRFTPSDNRFALGTEAKMTWVKILLANPTEQAQQVYLHHPHAYHNRLVGLYEVVDGDLVQSRVLDMDDPDTYQWIYDGSAVFAIELAPQQQKTLYVQSASFSHQWFTLGLYDEDHSKRALLGNYSDIAILVGMLLALILYNLLLYAYSRVKDSLFYAFYLISAAMWIALSYGLVADLFGIYGSQTLYWHLTLMTMPIFLILFMMDIFETRQHYRLEHGALLTLMWIMIAECIYGVIDIVGALRISSSLAVLMMLITLSVSISLTIKKHPVARYFLLGHSCFVVFSAIAVLFYKGMIPFTYLSSHGVGIGLMLEALVLALIIAYRIKLFEEIKASQEELKQQAATDPLTHLYNRRHFRQLGERLLEQTRAHQQALNVLICDIDLFKQVNDNYGHAIGDQAIIEVAQTLQKLTGPEDVLARYGGEEYILLLPNKTLEEACWLAEEIRTAVAALRIDTPSQPLSLTLSIGVSPVCSKQTLESAIKHADDALYVAKDAGRNRVQVSSSAASGIGR